VAAGKGTSRLARNTARALRRVTGKLAFRAEFDRFRRMAAAAGDERFPMPWSDRYPCLTDDTGESRISGHYLLHTAWAARKLAERPSSYHVDIGSSLGFNALVSAFVPVRFYDYRAPATTLAGLETGFADLTDLPFADEEHPSVSCMHVVEHVGLGRYGDRMDPEGDLKAIAELKRVTAPGGVLLFVVPVGRRRIQFNAHRIYGHEQVLSYFDGFDLAEFALIPDAPEDDRLIVGATPAQVDAQRYGCGCFLFVRRPSR
jgi:SAM-dependent methyltransferase